MDKITKLIRDGQSGEMPEPQLNVESIVQGVQSRIHRRTLRRKTFYSSPVVILLVLAVMVLFPDNEDALSLPGDELLMAGWEDTWTESQLLELDELDEQYLYDESVDYLTDDQYSSYMIETEELIETDGIEDFISYLEEV